MVRSVGLLPVLAFLLVGCLYSQKPLIEHPVFPLSTGTVQEFDFETKDRVTSLTPRVGSDGRLHTGRLDLVDGWYSYRDDVDGSVIEFRLAPTDAPSVFVLMARAEEEGKEPVIVYGAIEVRKDLVVSHGFLGSEFERYIQTSRWKDVPGWKIEKDGIAVFESLPFLQKVLPEMAAAAEHATAYKPVDPAALAAQQPSGAAPDGAPALDLAPTPPPSARERLEEECGQGAGIALSCKTAGDMYANGDGGPTDLMRAGQFYAWGCSAGNGESCGAALALALIVGTAKALTEPAAPQTAGGEEWSPSACCHGSEGNAPPTGSTYWEGHDLWCWTNYDYRHNDGTPATWCKNASGGVWEQGYISKCGGVEGWCD